MTKRKWGTGLHQELLATLQNIWSLLHVDACTQLAMHTTVMSYSSCNYRWDVVLATVSRGNDTSFLSHGQCKGGMQCHSLRMQ